MKYQYFTHARTHAHKCEVGVYEDGAFRLRTVHVCCLRRPTCSTL